jgi:murein DD-endopeptidase MepM/ murein hydrolase activator NlpD
LKRLISLKQRLNFDNLPSKLRYKQLPTTLAKLIGMVVVLGVLTPAQMAKASIQAKSSPINIGKEAYSLWSSAIADYTQANLIQSDRVSSAPIKAEITSKPEVVIANQAIPSRYTNSLIAKVDAGDSATSKLDFEPQADLSQVSEVIKPIIISRGEANQPLRLNALTPISPAKLIATETATLNDKPAVSDDKKLNTISSQLIENLESGIEAIASSSVLAPVLAPELPTLVAKIYLPETSDYGLSTNFVWPAQGLLSSGFGWRWGRLHQGIDIAAPVGTPIWAAGNGTVDYAGWNSGGYGNMVDILHPNGSITRYGHLSAIYVKPGETVTQSQVIAAMGNTGNSTGPHLHFEIRPNGRAAINPMTFLARVLSRG